MPKGFHAITPHIITADVGAAVDLYKKALGAAEVSIDHAPGGETVFAHLKIGNSALTIGQGESFGTGFVGLHLYVDAFDAIWDSAVNAGFVEVRAPEETYWGDLLGLLNDPLGVRWSIGKRIAKLSADERAKRAAEIYQIDAEPVEA